MGKGNYAQFFPMNVVNDAEREFPERESAPATPRRTQSRIGAQERECPFVLQDEGQSNVWIAFASIKGGAFG